MSKFLICAIILLLIAHKVEGQQVMEEFRKSLIEKEKNLSSFTATKKYGLIAEVHTYNYLLYDKLVVGGYYFAGTYRLLPKSTIGLGYNYSVYNQSILIDLRQELGGMRIKPILLGNFGYAFLGNKYTVKSSLDIPTEVKAKPNLAYNVGLGARMYFSRKTPIGFNFGLFYRNEPGFELSEGKSGIITIDKYRNIGSLCAFIGISM